MDDYIETILKFYNTTPFRDLVDNRVKTNKQRLYVHKIINNYLGVDRKNFIKVTIPITMYYNILQQNLNVTQI